MRDKYSNLETQICDVGNQKMVWDSLDVVIDFDGTPLCLSSIGTITIIDIGFVV